jgi:hypothetical protein
MFEISVDGLAMRGAAAGAWEFAVQDGRVGQAEPPLGQQQEPGSD